MDWSSQPAPASKNFALRSGASNNFNVSLQNWSGWSQQLRASGSHLFDHSMLAARAEGTQEK
jgi:hypothetical protein